MLYSFGVGCTTKLNSTNTVHTLDPRGKLAPLRTLVAALGGFEGHRAVRGVVDAQPDPLDLGACVRARELPATPIGHAQGHAKPGSGLRCGRLRSFPRGHVYSSVLESYEARICLETVPENLRRVFATP